MMRVIICDNIKKLNMKTQFPCNNKTYLIGYLPSVFLTNATLGEIH